MRTPKEVRWDEVVKIVIKYIKNQEKHQLDKTVIDEYELISIKE